MPNARHFFPVRDYDLGATLNSGQAFRWDWHDRGWEAVVSGSWVRLTALPEGIEAETAVDPPGWHWLGRYLQVDVDLSAILATFPKDNSMRQAMAACRGLRLLRQEPWECLASFIISSTKQIVQIRQIVRLLCERFGAPVPVPPAHEPAFAFPPAAKIATLAESDLRGCKMGFRAPYLLASARLIAEGRVALNHLDSCPVADAREELLKLPGVGTKIADCVLLFAFGFPTAFPVDIWVRRALRELYFPRRRVTEKRLRSFTLRHFGAFGGYAQQYLFHYIRLRDRGTAKAFAPPSDLTSDNIARKRRNSGPS